MLILWEKSEWPGSVIDQNITWLSWIPCKDKPTLQGHLAAGTQLGTVGVSLTSIPPTSELKITEEESRFADVNNGAAVVRRKFYNLRGHRSPVRIVEWNRAQTKLASCDEAGIVYVWIYQEERWSVELVNDRGVKIRDFSWSPTGNLALICYADNFVLVGSSSGQRIWSTQFDPDRTVQCGTWLPDEQGVVLGTAAGELVLMNSDGGQVGRYEVNAGESIYAMQWSGAGLTVDYEESSTLCVAFANGLLYFMHGCDDPDPHIEDTGCVVKRIQWSSSSQYLGFIGIDKQDNINQLRVYRRTGSLVLMKEIASQLTLDKPISAFCWGFDDRRLFIAFDNEVLVGQVFENVPRLWLLCADHVWNGIRSASSIDRLPLPTIGKRRIQFQSNLTVKCQVPDADGLMDYMCRPSLTRWYCTIIPEPSLATHLTATYTLCVEHLGGLVPVLRGRQINKIRPEFELRLYRPDDSQTIVPSHVACFSPPSCPTIHETVTVPIPISADAEDTRSEDSHPRNIVVARRLLTPERHHHTHRHSTGAGVAVTPSKRANMSLRSTSARDSVWRRSKRHVQAFLQRTQEQFSTKMRDRQLLTVSSNLWCTRFKIGAMDTSNLPSYLGQVVYKTSVLHLQPRQMSVHIVDLTRRPRGAPADLPNAPPDERDLDDLDATHGRLGMVADDGPPIAPLPAELFRGAPVFVDHGGNTDHTDGPREREVAPIAEPAQDLAEMEEQRLVSQVVRQFDELKHAVETHIQRMRDFAARAAQAEDGALTKSSLSLKVSGDTRTAAGASGGRSEAAGVSGSRTMADTLLEVPGSSNSATVNESRSDACLLKKATTPVPVTVESMKKWSEEISDLAFIDSDSDGHPGPSRYVQSAPASEAHCVPPSAVLATPPVATGPLSAQLQPRSNTSVAGFSRCLSTSHSTPIRTRNHKQLKELSTVLDKLSKLVRDLAPWRLSAVEMATRGHLPSDGHSLSKVSPLRKKLMPVRQAVSNASCASRNRQRNQFRDPTEQLNDRLQDLSLRIAQVESSISYGNEMLEDIRRDLSMRVERINSTLAARMADGVAGSDGSLATAEKSDHILILTNKTPFWNEASQVYQLDFGGRVTQESAKNFQIEHQSKQIMQFGRIESNAYTLDFQAPFAPAQAFAVALASITQRLK